MAFEIRYSQQPLNHPSHTHVYYELLYVLEGEVAMTIRGREHRVEAGSLVFLSPFDAHATRMLSPVYRRYYGKPKRAGEGGSPARVRAGEYLFRVAKLKVTVSKAAGPALCGRHMSVCKRWSANARGVRPITGRTPFLIKKIRGGSACIRK